MFWDFMQHRLVILYRWFGTNYWSHLQSLHMENLPSKPVTWIILSMKGLRFSTTPCLGKSWKPLIHFKNKKPSFGDTHFPTLQSFQCQLDPNLLYNLPLLPLIYFPACYLYNPGHSAVPLFPLAWYSRCLPFPSCIQHTIFFMCLNVSTKS